MDAKIVEGITDKDILELMEAYRPEVEQEGDITVTKAMKFWNVKRAAAEKTLMSMVEDGVLILVENVLLDNSAIGRVWRKA